MKTITDPFLRSYLLAAFWTSEYAEGSGDYEENGNWPELLADLSPEAMDAAKADCARFESENEALLSAAYGCPNEDYSYDKAGHDFWLTRNRHGAGFWDRDFPEEIGQGLSVAAHGFGETDLYRGDDGKLYFS